MNIPYIIKGTGITLFIDGRPVDIETTDFRYTDALSAAIAHDSDKLLEVISRCEARFAVKEAIASIEKTAIFGDLDIITSKTGEVTVTYKMTALPQCLQDKLVDLWRNGCTDFSHYYMFCEKLLANPSEHSRQQLYTFLDGQSLPITQDGNFIAYKGLSYNMVSVHGNPDTTVLSGERLSDGRIKNNVGDIIRVRAADVETNPDIFCSTGLHVGSYDYASRFGQIAVAVEVNPAHVISVPTDCSCQKCRVSEYKVLNVVKDEYTTAEVVVNTDASISTVAGTTRQMADGSIKQFTDVVTEGADYSQYREAIDRNIRNHGYQTNIAQLCGSVGRKNNINRATMLSILLQLGYTVDVKPEIGNSIVTF